LEKLQHRHATPARQKLPFPPHASSQHSRLISSVSIETLKHTHTLNVLLHCYNIEIDDHAAAVTGCSCLIFRLTLRMVTNSSAAEGWMPTTVSSCAFVTPIFKATAKPCKQTPAGHADGALQ
jgi:hypothetical protein